MGITSELKTSLARLAAKYPSGRKLAIRLAFVALKKAVTGQRKTRFKTNGNGIHVAFVLRGGLGDILMAGRYVYEFSSRFGQKCRFCLYTDRKPETVRSLFLGYPFAQNTGLIRDLDETAFDLVLDVVRFPQVTRFNREKISAMAPALGELVARLMAFQKDHPLFFRDIPLHDYLAVKFSRLKGKRRSTQIDILDAFDLQKSDFMLNMASRALSVLARHGLEHARFLTLQRGVGEGDGGAQASTRLWPLAHYEALIAKIRASYPAIPMVQLGSPDTVALKGVDLDLRGKTDFEELKVLLAGSSLHIDGDCGMVHMRHFLHGGPSCVLFGPTDETWLGYPENTNLACRACPGACEWLVPYWQNRCPLTQSDAACQEELTPDTVFKAIEGILGCQQNLL